MWARILIVEDDDIFIRPLQRDEQYGQRDASDAHRVAQENGSPRMRLERSTALTGRTPVTTPAVLAGTLASPPNHNR